MTKIHVEEVRAIEASGSGSVGWPTVTKTQSGELMAVYSGGRLHHVCPFGQVHFITSRDEGKTWTWPRVLVDGPLDDRDGGILETRQGTLIVNWFTSLSWEHAVGNLPERYGPVFEAEHAEWLRRQARLTDDVRQRELGGWCIRSTDGGQTWSPKIPTLVDSPHGPCQLSDDRLLYVGKKIVDHFSEGCQGSPFGTISAVAESVDDGQSWQLIAEIPRMAAHDAEGYGASYHEFHAVEAANGTIVAQIRNHSEPYKSETLQTESHDGGRTWSEVHTTGIWGFPAFLMRTSDDRLITTVGHRREPRGNQIAVSEDNGKSWSEAVPINTDSVGDMGYPSTVELSPGRFLSLWYDSKDRDQTYLRTAHWWLD